MQLSSGTLINGRYSIKSCIGQGGFGITYLAYDERLMQDVVLKEYFPDFMVKRDSANSVVTMTAGDVETYEKGKTRFLNEARLPASLRDLSEIVTIFDYFLENNTAYIVMEYIDGGSLKGMIKQRTIPFTYKEAMEIMMPCIKALQKVHEHGLIHRDFTPDNILLTKKGEVRIIDFGASKDYVASDKTMTVMVKHGYAPLEQYAQDGRQGTWTDVYSACAIIYEMLTLRKPQSAIDRSMADEVHINAIMNDSVSQEKKAVILKGLSLKSGDRYQTLEELIKDLNSPDRGIAPQTTVGPYYQNGQNYQGTQTVNTSYSQVYSTGQITQGGTQQYTHTGYVGNGNQAVATGGSTQKEKKPLLIPILIGAIAAAVAVIIVFAVILGGDSSGSKKGGKKTSETNDDLDEFVTENHLDDEDETDDIDTQDSMDDYEKPSEEEIQNHDTSTGNWDTTKERKVYVEECGLTVTVPAGYYYIDRTLGMDDTFVFYHFIGDHDEYQAYIDMMKEENIYIVLFSGDDSESEEIKLYGKTTTDTNLNELKTYSSQQLQEFYDSLRESYTDDGDISVDDIYNYRDKADNVLLGIKLTEISTGSKGTMVYMANGKLFLRAECILNDPGKVDRVTTQMVNTMQRISYK